jgi:hypothetical protein
MSYSSLILVDKPHVVWALDEPDGVNTVSPDGFSSPGFAGTYNSGKFFKGKIPITYSGTVCINNAGPWTSNNYSTDNTLFSIPSLDLFSAESKRDSKSLEFWMNLELPKDFNKSDENIIFGESKIVSLTGSNTNFGNSNTGLYIKNFEYLVFRVGDFGKASYDSEIYIENFNAPLHIVCLYGSSSIQIVVNGVPGRKVLIEKEVFLDKPFAETAKRFNFKFPAPLTATAPPFLSVSYDTVAVYNYQLSLDICKRHYVYGLGHTINKTLSSNFGGTAYDLVMEATIPVKKIDYHSSSTWSTSTVYDRLEFFSNNLITKRQPSAKAYLSSELNVTKSSMFITESGVDYIEFPENAYSYVEVADYERITDSKTSGLSFKFSIPATVHGSNEQQLFYIGSKSSKSSISATISGKIINIKQSINGLTETQMINDVPGGNFPILGNTFVVSLYVLPDGKIKFGIKDSSTAITTSTSSSISIFPLQDGYIRVGSAPLFFNESIPSGIGLNQIKRFDGRLWQIDIHNQDLTGLTNISNYPARGKTLLYQAYPISSEERMAIAVNGTFQFGFSLADLVPTEDLNSLVNDLRLPIAAEIGSNVADVKYTIQKTVNGVTTDVISQENAIDFRYLHLPVFTSGTVPKVSELYFNVFGTLRSIDNEKYPGSLNYLKAYSYSPKTDGSLKYLEINTDSRGVNPRLYSQVVSSSQLPFKEIPAIKGKTDLYRSFTTGVMVGATGTGSLQRSNYLSLPLSLTPTNEQGTYSIMFAGRARSGVTDINLLKYGSTEVKWSTRESGILHPSTGVAKLYINGEIYDSAKTYNINVWNHYAIVFNEGAYISNSNTLLFGFEGSAWQIDNLLITTGRPTPNGIQRIYSNAFSVYTERGGYGSASRVAMYINDSDKKSAYGIFQPLGSQASFSNQRIDVATTQPYSILENGASYRILYSGNTDITRFDGFQLVSNSVILFKDQPSNNTAFNGIYRVTSIDGNYINLTRIANPANNEVVYVSGGKDNKNYYFIKNSNNTYTRTVVQRKVITYISSVRPSTSVNIPE